MGVNTFEGKRKTQISQKKKKERYVRAKNKKEMGRGQEKVQGSDVHKGKKNTDGLRKGEKERLAGQLAKRGRGRRLKGEMKPEVRDHTQTAGKNKRSGRASLKNARKVEYALEEREPEINHQNSDE